MSVNRLLLGQSIEPFI